MPLGRYTTVFHAEVTAITIGIHSLTESDVSGRNINVFCLTKILEATSLICEIGLHWVFRLRGIVGNEEADRSMVVGAKTEFIGASLPWECPTPNQENHN